MALRVIMKGKANSIEEAKRFISNNHGPEPRYIYEDKEQNGKIWLSNQLGDPIGFYEPATKTVKMVDKKTVDALYKIQYYEGAGGETGIYGDKFDTLGTLKASNDKIANQKAKEWAKRQGYYDIKNIFAVKVRDADIKFVNKGQKFKNKNGAIVEVISDVDKLGSVTYKTYSPSKHFPDAYTGPVEGLINMLNKNGYVPTKDAAYFDPMYKDTRRAVVREAEKYLSSKGLNNSTGKYDKAIFGVRNLLEKTLLQPGTDKFNDAVHREVDRLLKKYNLTTDREPLEVIAEKNGYGLAVNEYNKLVLKFPGESYSNPHMYLGEYKGPYDKNYKKALDMFEKFAIKKNVKDAANGSVDDYLKKMNNKTQAEVEKILRQAKGNPNADKAYRIWKSTVKDADVEKEYSYSIRIGGDLKRVRVKADNSAEALEKVKKEAIKFKGERVKSKWDNNKLSTRDLTRDSNYFDKNELNNFSLDELKKMENTFKLKLSDLSKKYSKALKSNSREASSLGVSLGGTEKALFEIQAEIKRRR